MLSSCSFVTGFASAQQQDQIKSTVAGTGTSNPFFTSTANLAGVATDSSGNVFIVDYSDCAVYEFSGGTLTPIAGTPGSCGYSGDGGAATSAQLRHSNWGTALDSAGNLYIADFGNNAIREVTAPLATGTISTIAGDGTGNCVVIAVMAEQLRAQNFVVPVVLQLTSQAMSSSLPIQTTTSFAR